MDFHNCESTKVENNISCQKMLENENLTNSSNIINMDDENMVYGYKELQNIEKLCNHEIMIYHSTSPALSRGSSGCSQIHPDDQDATCLNLEESISFDLCEENPSLQDMLEPSDKSSKNPFAADISTLEDTMKPENDIEQTEMDLLDMHEEKPLYECSPCFTPSPLHLEDHHGFQQDLDTPSMKEILDTTFQIINHDYVDKFGYGYGQCKGAMGFGSEGPLPQISQRDFQQVIIKQLDLEDSHLFAESIEDHGSKEMQESPLASDSQDFLDEIMTCEGEGHEEIRPGADHLNVYGVCLEDLKLPERKQHSNIQSNMGLVVDNDCGGCSPLNKHIDAQVEGKRYCCLKYQLYHYRGKTCKTDFTAFIVFTILTFYTYI